MTLLRAAVLVAAGLAWSLGAGWISPAWAQTQKVEQKKKTKPKPEVTEGKYRDGQALEKKGDHRAALNSYLEAGNWGHGLAQKRLAEIYDKGSPATKRDYETALRWYEKARAQGIDVPKPHAYTKGH